MPEQSIFIKCHCDNEDSKFVVTFDADSLAAYHVSDALDGNFVNTVEYVDNGTVIFSATSEGDESDNYIGHWSIRCVAHDIFTEASIDFVGTLWSLVDAMRFASFALDQIRN